MGTSNNTVAIPGDIVHVDRDKYGNILVIDDRKHRILSFDSVFEQSKIVRATPNLPVHEYNRAMLLPIAFREPQHVTVLGLGGGVLAHGLHKLLPKSEIHVFELREKVAEIARKWFGLPNSSRLQVTIQDARLAVDNLPEASTDMILTDLYSADKMSPAQAQRQFIKACSRALTHTGWLALNYHKMPEVNGNLVRELRRQFPLLLVFRSKTNNWVIYGSKQGFSNVKIESSRCAELERRLPIGWAKLRKKLDVMEL
ncbi:spermidine synthase [Marinobacter sp. AL4B]|uniref:spermidine synthase n=1 Tax=Marinobacter sp. AL4B TaxID=2871173 RepID=UPI001CAA562F|nr:spermidine synthase [Marinobacter sp. AL4B]MBZ0332970.1 spermidine synthase [Marinobacter sp. AL4B]